MQSVKTYTMYTLQTVVKSLSIFYFVLLPVLYAQKIITARELGLVGALQIVIVIVGAVVVAKWLHKGPTRLLLQVASLFAMVASALLFAGFQGRSLALLAVAYGLSGMSAGLGMSGVGAVAASFTKRGNRFKSLAQLSMAVDMARMAFPLIVAGLIGVHRTDLAVALGFVVALAMLAASLQVPSSLHERPDRAEPSDTAGPSVLSNASFLKTMILEFLDSLASSQLFVFLPLLFLANGHSLASSLLLQTFVFAGYVSGRWIVGMLAHKRSGIVAVGAAEAGMVVAIVMLLLARQTWLLYALSYALGVFARGTSPAIKALAFDTLHDHHMKQGSAMHIVAGDSGSAIGQFSFGILIATWGVRVPFVVAAAVAGLVAILCLVFRRSLTSQIA